MKYDTSTLNGKIAVMQEYERTGKRPMCKNIAEENYRPLGTPPSWQWNDLDYNYPVEPTLKPWTFETTPKSYMLLKRKAQEPLIVVAVAWTRSAIRTSHPNFDASTYTFDYLLEHFEHSLDNGKTWQPCGTYES